MPRAIDELDEPRTIWSVVSRVAGGLSLLIGIACICVPFLGPLKEYRKRNEEGRQAEAKLTTLKADLEAKEAELQMMRSDPQFIELQARDRLEKYKEGEIIFRFEERK